jgi:hypothetical protein
MHVPPNQNHDRVPGHGHFHGHTQKANHTPSSRKVKTINGGPIPFAISTATYSNSPLSCTDSTGLHPALPRDTHA